MIPATKQLDQQIKKLLATSSRNAISAADRDKAKNQIAALAKSIADDDLNAIINSTTSYFLSRKRMKEIGQPQDFPIGDFLRLGDYGFSSSAEFGFLDTPSAFESLPIEMMIEHSLPSKCLDRAGKLRKDLVSRAIAIFCENPSKADETTTFDWVVQKAKPKELKPLLDLLFSSRERHAHLKTYEKLRGELLERDKSGVMLIEALTRAGRGELDLTKLGRTLVKAPKATCNFLRLCPKILPKPKAENALNLLQITLDGLLTFDLAFRGEVSGHLAVLAGELLRKPKRKSPEETALRIISGSAEQLQLSPSDAREGFSFLVFAGSNTLNSRSKRQLIHPDGADILLAALPKIKDPAFDPPSVFEATIENLGMERIEELGATVLFNPVVHEDTVGGLLPSEPCRVLECGWRLADRTVMRAKVSPAA